MEQDMRVGRVNGLVSRLIGAVQWHVAKLGGRPSSAGKEHRVDLESLSPHILRDLGISADHARDLAAGERARFLS
ncbi:MAG: hypothetical protein J0626_03655 [Rhodospirillaceae bacterium]|nr:hypothetical protein [Rhodospirillaceae bacterium]